MGDLLTPGAAAERGFAIPVTIFLIVLLTTMLSAGFVRVRADRQVAEATEVSALAEGIARSGLNEYVEATTARPTNGFTDTMYVTGGYAIIRGWVVRNPADTMAAQEWILQSTGYAVSPGAGGAPRGRRTVGQFAQWQVGYLLPRGGIAAPNGVRVRRYGYVYFRGDDWGGCTAAPITAIRASSLTNDGNPYLDVYGSPNVTIEGAGAIANGTEIDWAGVMGGDIRPDYTTLVQRWDYPIVLINGNLNVSAYAAGSGLLIVTGDVEITSSFIWFGALLAGGRIRFRPPGSGIAYVRGLTVSGLNYLIGSSPGATEFGDGSSSYEDSYAMMLYDSCQARYALSQLTGFSLRENALVANWPTY